MNDNSKKLFINLLSQIEDGVNICETTDESKFYDADFLWEMIENHYMPVINTAVDLVKSLMLELGDY